MFLKAIYQTVGTISSESKKKNQLFGYMQYDL